MLEIFKSEEFGEIRVLEQNGEPWFVGKDVAKTLDYKEPHKAVVKHTDEDDRIKYPIIDELGRNQDAWLINESGLYSLILGSKLPNAKKFKHWVTSEVLPSVRKHGMYATDELLANPDFAIKVFEQLKIEREEKEKLKLTIKENEHKVIFADAVATSHTSILIGDLAKLIKQKGYEIGQNRLFSWMRENGYLIKSGERKNMPTQTAMEQELFEVKERTVVNPDGSNRITRTTKVTGKGQIYFINKFIKN